MTKYLLGTITFILAVSVFAAIKGAPFMPETDARMNLIENRAATLEASTLASAYIADGVLAKKIVRATLDCSTASNCTIGAHALGVALPAKSILTRTVYYVAVQGVSAGSGTIAVSCEDANNILTAANLTSYAVGSIRDGNQTGVSNTSVASIGAACNVTATIATGDYTAGKLNFFIEYLNHD
jgi:hypothetical protein